MPNLKFVRWSADTLPRMMPVYWLPFAHWTPTPLQIGLTRCTRITLKDRRFQHPHQPPRLHLVDTLSEAHFTVESKLLAACRNVFARLTAATEVSSSDLSSAISVTVATSARPQVLHAMTSTRCLPHPKLSVNSSFTIQQCIDAVLLKPLTRRICKPPSSRHHHVVV